MVRGFSEGYYIRKTNTSNKTGDNYAITIPRFVAETFVDTWFRILVSGGNIIFESGCKAEPKKQDELMFDNKGGKRLYFEDVNLF